MNALRGAGWWMCNGVVVFYLVLNSRMVTDRRDSLIAVLVFGAAIVGLTELIPYLAQTLETQQFTRLRGHKFSPILLSTIVVMSLPWSLTRSICAPPSALQKLYWLATFILSITAFLTLSRSGLVATACAGLFVLWPLKRKLAIGSVIAIGAVVAVLGFSGDQRMHPLKTFAEFGQTTTRQARVLQRLHEDPRLIHIIGRPE